MFEASDLIHSYTRRQAIEDGVLVQLSGDGYEGDSWIPEMCREAGFRFPLAMTVEAFMLVVKLSPAAKRACNDLQGRLWDVLWMLKQAIRSSEGDTINFSVYCVTERIRPTRVNLKAVCGPGDDIEPVITIMLQGQD